MDTVSAADRLYRAFKRSSSPRLAFVSPDGLIASRYLNDSKSRSMLNNEPGRVMGVYDSRAEPDAVFDDVEFMAQRFGL